MTPFSAKNVTMKRTFLRMATVAALVVAGALIGAYLRGRESADIRAPLTTSAAHPAVVSPGSMRIGLSLRGAP